MPLNRRTFTIQIIDSVTNKANTINVIGRLGKVKIGEREYSSILNEYDVPMVVITHNVILMRD